MTRDCGSGEYVTPVEYYRVSCVGGGLYDACVINVGTYDGDQCAVSVLYRNRCYDTGATTRYVN